ncbi:MAG: hypothetical protein HFJ10_06725 [Lachnospiraceae bacterium]|nr:hypothetical protein [Lachnospiraceae bacterium]
MYTLVLFLLAIFSLYIGAWAFLRWDASWLRNMNMVPIQILIILVGIIFLCAMLLLVYRFLQRLEDQKLKRLALICMVILTVGQLLLLFLIRPMLRYDQLKTFDMAVEMLRTHTISETYETGYFARYTNNYPITILTYWFLLVLSKLGVQEVLFMPAVQLVNIVCILGSVWLGYLIVKELKSRREAVFYLIVCVLCPLSYVWAGFFYTTTCSMPFLMGILYLYLRIPKAQTVLQRTLLGGLWGAVLILGYKLRATAMIAWIAAMIVIILKLWKLFISSKSGQAKAELLRKICKKYVTAGAAFLLTAVLSLGFWSSVTDRYVTFDYKNTGFPMIHWIMMSARWDGAYDLTDELYTFSFETKEEKIEADKKVLLERIREAGPVGLISLAGRKLLNTWVDGTDTYPIENDFCHYSRLYDYLFGNKSGFLTIYSQVIRAFQMVVIGLMALFSLVKLWRRRDLPGLFLIQLTLLGGMAFHLIWETNPLYSISFTFLGLILLTDGIVCLAEQKIFAPVLKKGWIGCAGALVLLLILLIFGKKELVETPIEENHYCVNQYQYAGGFAGYVTDYEQTYVQTFTTDRPFNRISVHAVNSVGEYNQSAFLVKLTAEDGTVLYDNDRFLSGMVVANTPYEFQLDPVIPEGPTTYTLEITPGYIEGENSLEFLSYNTGNCDMYSGGTLTVGGEEQKYGDLTFAVYEYKVTTYFDFKVYLILCVVLLILAGGITFGMRYWFYLEGYKISGDIEK